MKRVEGKPNGNDPDSFPSRKEKRRSFRTAGSPVVTNKKRKNLRTDLLSRDAAVQVPSAQLRFTTQFGMGWGGSTAL